MSPVNNATTRKSAPHLRSDESTVVDHRKHDVSPDFWADASSNIPPRYQVLAQLGIGGSGVVFKVRDLEAGEVVALKMLKPGMASSQAMQESLRKEVCLARKVTHRNVCRIYEFNRSNATACISMEFVEGESLLAKLSRVGPLQLNEALSIARQICAGLREAHSQSIIHRDLKPANVMLDRRGTVKIMDFGIARLAEDDGKMTGTIAGTPAYMAPEQLELGAMSPQTDIYALGLLLYEMITGSPAFDGDTPFAVALKQIREVPKRPREICPTLPARLEAIILKCLQKDPAKRFQSIDELDTAMRNATIARDVTWQNALERRLAQVAEHRIVTRGRERIRAAGPQLVAAVVKVRGASLQASRVVKQSVASGTALVRAKDWRALSRTRSVQVAAVIFASVVIFGMAATRKSQANELRAKSADAAAQTAQSGLSLSANKVAGQGHVPGSAGGRNVTTAHVDLNSSFAGHAARTRDEDSSTRETSQSSANNGKLQLQIGASSPSAARSRSAASNPRNSQLNNAQPAHTAAPVVTAATAQAPTTVEPDLGPSAIVPTAAPAPSAESADASAAKPTEKAGIYLEVGSFKDESWAQNAVDQLSKLGYHAVSVHQTRLWMQSYHVHVGPYADSKELADAQQSLAARGFKSHPVK